MALKERYSKNPSLQNWVFLALPLFAALFPLARVSCRHRCRTDGLSFETTGQPVLKKKKNKYFDSTIENGQLIAHSLCTRLCRQKRELAESIKQTNDHVVKLQSSLTLSY